MLTRFLLCLLAGRKKMPFIMLNVNQHYSATVNIERPSCCLYCAKVNSAVLFKSLYRRTVMQSRQSRHRTAATGGAKSRRVGAGAKKLYTVRHAKKLYTVRPPEKARHRST